MTQPVFQPDEARSFIQMIHKELGDTTFPILAGILPLANARHASFLDQEVPGITIPEGTLKRMRTAGENSSAEGVKIAVELAEDLKAIFTVSILCLHSAALTWLQRSSKLSKNKVNY